MTVQTFNGIYAIQLDQPYNPRDFQPYNHLPDATCEGLLANCVVPAKPGQIAIEWPVFQTAGLWHVNIPRIVWIHTVPTYMYVCMYASTYYLVLSMCVYVYTASTKFKIQWYSMNIILKRTSK